MISLFKHNLLAYDAAVKMMNETGKSAVVHPTGTGKSFIAFKLAEDNADLRVCWLSPSKYIFQTQLENLQAAGFDAPKTYSFLHTQRRLISSRTQAATGRSDVCDKAFSE